MIEDVAAKIECELVLAVSPELSVAEKEHNAA